MPLTYCDRLISYASASWANIIQTRERIKDGLNSKKSRTIKFCLGKLQVAFGIDLENR